MGQRQPLSLRRPAIHTLPLAYPSPRYYDCAAAPHGFGLPVDVAWLRRAGMRSVLALPAMGSHVRSGSQGTRALRHVGQICTVCMPRSRAAARQRRLVTLLASLLAHRT